MLKPLSVIVLNVFAITNVFAANNDLLSGSESPVSVTNIPNGKCYLYSDTTVITKNNGSEVGEVILIKTIADKKCKWDKSAWKITGPANYYFGKFQNLIFVDNGTGPDLRQISIFDINSHIQQFNDTYVEPISIIKNQLSYWQSAVTIANKQNCDKFTEASKTGLTPQIQKQMQLNLSNGNFSGIPSGKIRCELTR
ncbi:MAG: hypothetical protein E6Q33_06360 [Neisseriales bacterium]|nr:MAG: hypothetical protein E6Q33_06360 [Neisseriales bacterium]